MSIADKADLQGVLDGLQSAKAVVHLVGANYGFVPEGEERSVVELQIEETTAFAPRLFWLTPTSTSPDVRLSRLIDRIREHAPQSGGVDVLANSEWTFNDEGRVDDRYRDVARTLGGCPDNQVTTRFQAVSILNTATQESFVAEMCNPGGASEAAVDAASAYAKERRQFGRAIGEFQGIAFMLADMATQIEASRLMVWRASWLSRNGGGYTIGEGSMSKLMAGRTAVWVTERAIQILGGYGYTREYPVERYHRDAKIYDIFEGTEQIQQLVIARAISGLRIE